MGGVGCALPDLRRAASLHREDRRQDRAVLSCLRGGTVMRDNLPRSQRVRWRNERCGVMCGRRRAVLPRVGSAPVHTQCANSCRTASRLGALWRTGNDRRAHSYDTLRALGCGVARPDRGNKRGNKPDICRQFSDLLPMNTHLQCGSRPGTKSAFQVDAGRGSACPAPRGSAGPVGSRIRASPPMLRVGRWPRPSPHESPSSRARRSPRPTSAGLGRCSGSGRPRPQN